MNQTHTLPSIKMPLLGDFDEPDMQFIRRLCETLGLYNATQIPPFRPLWTVECRTIQNLQTTPSKIPHAGQYEWVGDRDERPPKWLWDSQEYCTVEATKERLDEGYIAISYTWGRWKCGETSVPGTTWPVPLLREECKFNLKTLQDILHCIPSCRYFWVDVLCINQANDEELRQEISKQGSIFAQARGTITYLWTIESGDHLSQAICDLGDFVLHSIELSLSQDRSRSSYTSQGSQEYRTHAEMLQRDRWFSSLWTLQEMILFPSSIWIAVDGNYCAVNGETVTTAFVASACSLVETMCYTVARQECLRLLPRMLLVDSEIESWISAVRREEPDWRTEFRGWKTFLGEHAAIKCSLTASRSTLLHAASKRIATEKRGEAVLAAMKLAYNDSYTDETKLAPGGLPVGLVNEIIRLDGRMVFNSTHAPKSPKNEDRFFSDIIPMTALFVTDGPNALGIESLAAENWYIDVDGTLHISPESIFQQPSDQSDKSVHIVLHFKQSSDDSIPVHMTVEESRARGVVEEQYQLWLKLYDISTRNGEFPTEIDVLFLPIGVRTGNVAVLGVIIAQGRGMGIEKSSQRWYKCGTYVAKSFDTFTLEHEIIVGKIAEDGSIQHKE